MRTDYFSCFKNSNDDFPTFHKLFLQLFFLSSYTKNLPFALFGWGYPTSWFVYKKKKIRGHVQELPVSSKTRSWDMILSMICKNSRASWFTWKHPSGLQKHWFIKPTLCVESPTSSRVAVSWLLSLAIAVGLDLSSLILSCTSLASQPTSLKRHAATACFLSYSKKNS